MKNHKITQILSIVFIEIFLLTQSCYGIIDLFNSDSDRWIMQPSVIGPENISPSLPTSEEEPAGMIHIIWDENTTADGIVDWTTDQVKENLPVNIESFNTDLVKYGLFEGKNLYYDLSGDKTLIMRIDTYDWVNEAGKVTITSKNWGNDSLFRKYQNCGATTKLGDYINAELAFHMDYYYIDDNVVDYLFAIESEGWGELGSEQLGQLAHSNYTPGKFKISIAGEEKHFDNYGEVIKYFSEVADSGVAVAKDTPVPTETPTPAPTPTPTSTPVPTAIPTATPVPSAIAPPIDSISSKRILTGTTSDLEDFIKEYFNVASVKDWDVTAVDGWAYPKVKKFFQIGFYSYYPGDEVKVGDIVGPEGNKKVGIAEGGFGTRHILKKGTTIIIENPEIEGIVGGKGKNILDSVVNRLTNEGWQKVKVIAEDGVWIGDNYFEEGETLNIGDLTLCHNKRGGCEEADAVYIIGFNGSYNSLPSWEYSSKDFGGNTATRERVIDDLNAKFEVIQGATVEQVAVAPTFEPTPLPTQPPTPPPEPTPFPDQTQWLKSTYLNEVLSICYDISRIFNASAKDSETQRIAVSDGVALASRMFAIYMGAVERDRYNYWDSAAQDKYSRAAYNLLQDAKNSKIAVRTKFKEELEGICNILLDKDILLMKGSQKTLGTKKDLHFFTSEVSIEYEGEDVISCKTGTCVPTICVGGGAFTIGEQKATVGSPINVPTIWGNLSYTVVDHNGDKSVTIRLNTDDTINQLWALPEQLRRISQTPYNDTTAQLYTIPPELQNSQQANFPLDEEDWVDKSVGRFVNKAEAFNPVVGAVAGIKAVIGFVGGMTVSELGVIVLLYMGGVKLAAWTRHEMGLDAAIYPGRAQLFEPVYTHYNGKKDTPDVNAKMEEKNVIWKGGTLEHESLYKDGSLTYVGYNRVTDEITLLAKNTAGITKHNDEFSTVKVNSSFTLVHDSPTTEDRYAEVYLMGISPDNQLVLYPVSPPETRSLGPAPQLQLDR